MNREDYLLVCLSEECAELQHAVAKALRFGLDHEWPGKGGTNRQEISKEFSDVVRIAGLLEVEITPKDDPEKFGRMMRLSQELGRLDAKEPT